MMNSGGEGRELELRTLLNDERDRCIQYKQIYESIKDKHSKLQDDLALIRDQLKEAVINKEKLESSYKLTIRTLEENLKEQRNEVKILTERLKSRDETKIRSTVLEEVSTEYETKIKELHLETDKIRDQYNTLHYENVVLKCSIESKIADHARMIDRVNRLHEAEVDQLKTKLEAMVKEKSLPMQTYALELKSSKREILELNTKVKSLLSECEELRAQNENFSLQINSMSRTSSKQIIDHAANLRLLESEKSKIVMQKEILEKELSNAQEHRKLLTAELQASRREAVILKGKLEECEHHCQLNFTNYQVEMDQHKSMHDSDRELFSDEITRLKVEIQAVMSTASQEQQTSLARETSLEQSLNNTRQQLWKQSREFNTEREEMKKKIKEIMAEKDGRHFEQDQDVLTLKQNLAMCSAARNELEKEVVSLREKLSSASNNVDNPNQVQHSSSYHRDLQYLKEKIDLLSAGGQSKTNADMSSKSQTDHEVVQLKLGWEQQKLQYHQRLEELEAQLRELRGTSAAEKRESEFKTKQLVKQVDKLKDKVLSLKAQKEDLDVQKEEMEQVQSQLQHQLERLQQQLGEYSMLIASDPAKPLSSEKMLTDIQNLQFIATSHRIRKDKPSFGVSGTDKQMKDAALKKRTKLRRKSLKSRDTQQHSKTTVFSSSSDLDLENL